MKPLESVEQVRKDIEVLLARIAIDDECAEHLFRLYSMIWTEACYDPDSDASQKFAQRLLPHIQALNVKLKFK